MKKGFLKMLSICLSVIFVFSATGCSDQQSESGQKGVYVETNIMIPAGTTHILDVKSSGNNIFMAAIVEDSDTILWRTDTDGQGWEECMSLPEELKNSFLFSGVITNENAVFFAAYEDYFNQQEDASVIYGRLDESEGLETFALPISNQGKLAKFTACEDRIFASDDYGYLYEVYEDQATCLNPQMESKGIPYDFLAYEDTLLALYGESFKEYHVDSGEETQTYKQYGDFCTNKIRGSGTSSLLGVGTDGKLLFFSADGLFQYELETNESKKIFSGETFAFSREGYTLQKLVTCNEDTYLVAGSSQKGPILYKYAYDENATSVADSSLTIYALRDSNLLRTLIDGFKEKNPSILIHTEIGFDGSAEMTLEDAIRAFNLSLFAENGPDIIVLDELPMDSYIEQGSLKNLEKIIEKESLNVQILEAFEEENGMYGVPTGYTILDMHGREEVIEEAKSIASLAEVVEKNRIKNQISAVDLWYGNSTFSSLFYYYFPQCIDKTGNIVEENLSQFLESMKTIYECSEYNWTVEVEGIPICNFENASPENMQQGDLMLYIDEAQLMAGELQTVGDVQLAYLLETEHKDLQCTFLDEESIKYFIPELLLGISENTSNEKMAEEFIQYALSEEGQIRQAEVYECFSVNNQVFDQFFQNTYHEYSIYDRNDKKVVLEAEEIKEKDMTYLKNLFGQNMERMYSNTDIKEMVLTILSDYINQTITLEQAVEQCVQKVGLYLNE